MVFRLDVILDPLDTEPRKIVAQPRQRTFIEKASEIIRTVGHQLAASNADEQLEELTFYPGGICFLGRLGERGMRETER